MIRICCTGVVVSSNIPRISQNKSCKLPKGIPFRFNVYFILRFALLTCFVTQLYTDFRAHIPVIHTRIGAFVCMWVWVQCSHSHCNYLYMGTMLSFFLSLPVVFVSLIFNYFLDISDSVRKMGGWRDGWREDVIGFYEAPHNNFGIANVKCRFPTSHWLTSTSLNPQCCHSAWMHVGHREGE